jgi:hypothetical protein
VATNDGTTLYNVTISDLIRTLTCTPAQPATLAPALRSCTGSHAVTQATWTPGSLTTPHRQWPRPANQPVSATASAWLPAGEPHLSLTKSASLTSHNTVGDVINYTIVATNDGASR